MNEEYSLWRDWEALVIGSGVLLNGAWLLWVWL